MSILPLLFRCNNRISTSLGCRASFSRHLRLSIVPLLQAEKTEQIIEVVHPNFQKMKNKQKKFQLDDGLPVHMKLGAKDKMLYQFTLLLLATGLLMGLHTLVMCVLKRS